MSTPLTIPVNPLWALLARVVPTTFPAAPTTLPAAADDSLAMQLVVTAFFGAIALTIAAFAWHMGWIGGRREPQWSFPRCPLPGQAGRLWIGAAAMAAVFLAPAMLVMLLRPASTAAATTAPAAPSAARDALGLAVMGGVYLLGFAAVAGVHRLLGWREALAALGLTPGPLSVAYEAKGPAPADASRSLGYAPAAAPRRRDAAWAIALGAPFGVAATMCAAQVTQFVWTLIGYHHASAHELLQLMQRAEQSPLVLVVAIVNATLLAPAFEELLFRGHVQTALTGLIPGRRWPAIVIASLVFAMLHDAWMRPPILVLSLVIGYLYERTGNLWVAIAAHVAFNSTSTLLFLATRGGM